MIVMVDVKEILNLINDLSEKDKALIEKAYEFAKHAHEGQKRMSGEPYFIHVHETAKILAEQGMDANTIAATAAATSQATAASSSSAGSALGNWVRGDRRYGGRIRVGLNLVSNFNVRFDQFGDRYQQIFQQDLGVSHAVMPGMCAATTGIAFAAKAGVKKRSRERSHIQGSMNNEYEKFHKKVANN
jgi:hypothetical protein